MNIKITKEVQTKVSICDDDNCGIESMKKICHFARVHLESCSEERAIINPEEKERLLKFCDAMVLI